MRGAGLDLVNWQIHSLKCRILFGFNFRFIYFKHFVLSCRTCFKVFLLVDFFLCYLFVDSFEQFGPKPLIILGTTLSLMLSLEVVCHLDCLCSDVTVWSFFLRLHMYRPEAGVCFPLLLSILFFWDWVFTESGSSHFARPVASTLWDPLLPAPSCHFIYVLHISGPCSRFLSVIVINYPVKKQQQLWKRSKHLK